MDRASLQAAGSSLLLFAALPIQGQSSNENPDAATVVATGTRITSGGKLGSDSHHGAERR